MVELLLATENVNPDYEGRTPLSWAAEDGQKIVVKLLVATEGVNPNSKDFNARTPGSLVAEHGHEIEAKLQEVDGTGGSTK